MAYKVAVVGATGNVGRTMLNVLDQRQFPASEIAAIASSRSIGREVSFGEDHVLKIKALDHYDFQGTDICLMSAGGAIAPLAQGDLATLMQSEAARVRVINNTYTEGLAKRTAAFLTAKGLQVAEIGAPTGDATQTILILYSSKLYTLKYLTELLGLTSYQIVMKPNSTSTVDIELRLGEDWIGKLPDGF